MKKISFFMLIAFIAIMCTFAAGCIGQPNVDEMNSQQKFEYYTNIANSHPDRTIKDDSLDFLYSQGGLGQMLNSKNTFRISNGIMLDSKVDTDFFLINDASVTKGYGLIILDSANNEIAYIMYAPPNEYDGFLSLLEIYFMFN